MLDEIIEIFKNELNFRKLVFAKLPRHVQVVPFFIVLTVVLVAIFILAKDIATCVLFALIGIGLSFYFGRRVRSTLWIVYKIDSKGKRREDPLETIRIQKLRTILAERKIYSLEWMDRAVRIVREKEKRKEFKVLSPGPFTALWLPVFSAFIGWRFATLKEAKDVINYFSFLSVTVTLFSLYVWSIRPLFQQAILVHFNREATYLRELADCLEKMAIEKVSNGK